MVDLIVTKSSGVGTRGIGHKPATNLLHGVRFAGDRGRPLTVCATLGWHWIGLESGAAKEVFRRLRQKVRRRWVYLREVKGMALGSFDDVGVHEAPGDRANTHWMMRVPPDLRADFELTVERLLKKMLPGKDLDRVIHFQDIYAPGSLAKYALKGIHPMWQGYFHIKAVDQGFIPGRGRTFVSRSLSMSARKAAAWKRRRRRDEAGTMPAKGGAHSERPAPVAREPY